ncbi:hypothetical protein Ac2012v2_005501 [Leucoagaricus gongylophorus]
MSHCRSNTVQIAHMEHVSGIVNSFLRHEVSGSLIALQAYKTMNLPFRVATYSSVLNSATRSPTVALDLVCFGLGSALNGSRSRSDISGRDNSKHPIRTGKNGILSVEEERSYRRATCLVRSGQVQLSSGSRP